MVAVVTELVQEVASHTGEIITAICAGLLTYTTMKGKILSSNSESEKYQAESVLIQMLRDQLQSTHNDNTRLSLENDELEKAHHDCEHTIKKLDDIILMLESKVSMHESVIAHLTKVLKDTRDSIATLYTPRE